MSNDEIKHFLDNFYSSHSEPFGLFPFDEPSSYIQNPVSSTLFHIQQIEIIEETDTDSWDPEREGYAYIWGPISPEGVSPNSAIIYPPAGHTYELNPSIGTSHFGRFDSTDPMPIIVDVKDFFVSCEPISQDPTCRFFIPSQNFNDPALILHDYPFTISPLESKCINPNMGASPHKPVVCGYGENMNCVSCPKYEEFESVQIGSLEGGPIILHRLGNSNRYEVGEQIFDTYVELSNWSEQNDLNFILTYQISSSQQEDFYSGAMSRMARTYEKT